MKLFTLFRVIMGLFLVCQNASAFIVVSDFDDTVRESDVSHTWGMIERVFFKTWQPFAGAPAFLNALDQARFRLILSGSPKFLSSSIREFLEKYDFDARIRLSTRPLLQDSSTPAFKTRILNQVVADYPGESLVLLGDDTEKDPETFTDFSKKHPGIVSAIYIHRITGRELPAGVMPFFDYYSVAFEEASQGRITQQSLDTVLRSVLNASEEQMIAPYAVCPASGEFVTRNDEVTQWIQAICKKRQ